MNYYEVLKVSKSASQQEIRDSYKSLIKKYHPDIYKGNHEYAEKVTKQLNDAYDILSNPESRKEYDVTLIPPETNNSTVSSYNYSYNRNNNYTNSNTNTEHKETVEEKMKKKIYNIVDKKTSNMSEKSKLLMIFFIIIFALFCFAMSIQDYINIINYSKKQKEIQNQIYQNMIINSLQNSISENIVQNITENNVKNIIK